jgi:hypothetical protein
MLQYDAYQEAAYDLFVTEIGLSTDLGDYANLHFPHDQMQALNLTESSFRIMLANQPAPFAVLPFAQRFSTAINAICWPANAFSTLLLRPDPIDTVARAGKDGKTALHWAAAHFGEWLRRCACPASWPHDPRKRAESYGSLACKLLRKGSDVHALWSIPVSESGEIHSLEIDPFITFLRGSRPASLDQCETPWTRESLLSAVKQWGQMLVAGGSSLPEYVVAENHFLSATHYIDASPNPGYGTWTFIPTKLAMLEDGTLSAYVIDVVNLLTWRAEPVHVPGAWPVVPLSSSTIIWRPGYEDFQDGFQWSITASLELVSDPYEVRSLGIQARSSDLVDWGSVARHHVFSKTQDDHGKLANIISRETRFCRDYSQKQNHRRAASLPPFPTNTRLDLRYGSSWSTDHLFHTGTYALHKCGSDLRWSTSSGRTTSLRQCMQNHQRDRERPTPRGGPQGWEHDLLFNEDHVRVARRFAERLRPEWIRYAEETSNRAVERARLMTGPRQREDDGM